METSESVKNIASALCNVQKHLKPLRRNADNPFFKSNYTDLAAMSEALYPLLTAEGLSVVQGGDGSTLDTMLLHTSGEWIRTSLTMPAESNPQKLGSIVTYFRRYALAALVGAVSEGEDDDGNAAAHPPSRPTTATPRHTAPPQTTPAAPPASGGSPASLFVKAVDESSGQGKNGKPYTRWTASFSDGTRASTFSESDGKILKNAKSGGLPVLATFEKQGNFVNLVSVRIDGPAESSDDESVQF